MVQQLAPLTGVYAQADTYLEAIAASVGDKCRQPTATPDDEELMKTLVHLMRLNRREGRVSLSPNVGKATEIARLMGTDYFHARIDTVREQILRLTVFDYVSHKDVLEMIFVKCTGSTRFDLHRLDFL